MARPGLFGRRPLPVVTVLWLLTVVAGPAAGAAGLTVAVRDQKGDPVEGAVVVATPRASTPALRPQKAIMDQVDKQFVPELLTITVGAEVRFPNRDDIRHHVYSFSDAKKFELPLYKGEDADPVMFEQPGPVVLGCNIHDHMRAYIYVSDSPYFGTTGEDGRVMLGDLPAADYRLTVWHPQEKTAFEPLTASAAEPVPVVEVELQLKPALRLRRGTARGKKY